MKILLTGCAGFIGMHAALRLLSQGHSIVGIDNLNDYYDPTLKESRLNILQTKQCFSFNHCSVDDKPAVHYLFEQERFDVVLHLAAQAGVRYSLENPYAYINSNLVGFANILECCRHFPVKHLFYASSSSVYGGNKKLPYSEKDAVDHPVSLYAATKKANELMAHSYSHLFSIPTTGLRFFTVYGAWGRPDMAPFLFTKAILNGDPIKVFNYGKMRRDFTFIDDVVDSICALVELTRSGSSGPLGHYQIFNIGNSAPVELEDFIAALENALKVRAVKNYLPLQPGDVLDTYADTSLLESVIGRKPATPIRKGIDSFVGWYREYYDQPIDVPK